MCLRRPIAPALLALAALLAPAAQQARASELETKMKALAKKLANLLEKHDQTTVAVGEFTGPPSLASSSGPGLQHMLVAELGKLKVRLDEKSHLVVKGDYLAVDGKDEKGIEDDETVALRLVLTVRTKQARLVQEITEDLPINKAGTQEAVKILGLQAGLENYKKASDADLNRRIKRQMEKPPLAIDDCKIKTFEKSPYAVEVLVRRKGEKAFKPVTPRDKDGKGLAFVDLEDGDVYRLRLHNSSDIEAVATVTIDGVDAMQFFEPPGKRPGSFLVRKNASREVKGWLRSTEKVNEFRVGSFAESAAARVLKSSARLGTIVVCFHPAWTGNKPPAAYEGARSIDGKGTGLGDEIKEKSTVVKRTIGPLAASIVIRYDK